MTKFEPGMYKMRNGEKAEVFAERDDIFYGRYLNSDRSWISAGWNETGGFYIRGISDYDLLSPWTEERKPFECWVNRYTDSHDLIADPTERGANAFSRNRIGPAIRMIEATPLTEHAGDLRDALREAPCPRPANDMPDDTTAGQCFDAKSCGCIYGAALAKAKP